ncbi:hypothetical protein [Chryseobacterium sp. JV274]|uniref:hypothetical protein n=1 Tax=unclassified Chryseobacterium TaxID=2593645 RepID=UPI0015C1D76C|nr:hypothetical protein [Chryseobacterium sp. JV274]CAD0221362.1 conserved protein of unknown function [Chryseobacterium sp. JV274]
MKKIIALTSVILILTLYNYPIFDDKKITFTIIFMCFVVIIFSLAKLYSGKKEDYDSVEKEMDILHEDNGIFEYTNDGFYFKQKNITEFIKWDEINTINRFTFPVKPYGGQSGLEVITDQKNYEFNDKTNPGIVKLTDQLYSYLPDWEEDSPMEINNFGLKKTKLYERKPLQ